MVKLSVLIVEDDDEASARLSAALVSAGHDVRVARSVEAAKAMHIAAAPDVIVLDRMIDGRDALDQFGTTDGRLFPQPVLVLTGLSSLDERIAGLNAGADDYLIKPASPREVEARLRALVRRPLAPPADQIIKCGALDLDRMRREARFRGRRIALQPREFRLLEELAASCEQVVSRRTLLEEVWGLKFDPKTKLIETHLSRLRDKLGDAEGMPVIETVRGVGYRLVGC